VRARAEPRPAPSSVGYDLLQRSRKVTISSDASHHTPPPSLSPPARPRAAGTPFAGELVIGDVVYKTLLLSLPCLVPGGLCSPPVHATAPCLVVLRLDATRPEGPCKGRGVIVYAHGNAVDIGAVAEEAKAMSHHLHCHVIVPEYPGYGVAKGKPCEVRSIHWSPYDRVRVVNADP